MCMYMDTYTTTSTCMYTHMYMHTHTCSSRFMCKYTCMYTLMTMRTHTSPPLEHVYIHFHMQVHIHAHAHVNIHVHVHTYTHTYKYTYTYLRPSCSAWTKQSWYTGVTCVANLNCGFVYTCIWCILSRCGCRTIDPKAHVFKHHADCMMQLTGAHHNAGRQALRHVLFSGVMHMFDRVASLHGCSTARYSMRVVSSFACCMYCALHMHVRSSCFSWRYSISHIGHKVSPTSMSGQKPCTTMTPVHWSPHRNARRQALCKPM